MTHVSGLMMIRRWSTNFLEIIVRELGKTKRLSPIYCVKITERTDLILTRQNIPHKHYGRSLLSDKFVCDNDVTIQIATLKPFNHGVKVVSCRYFDVCYHYNLCMVMVNSTDVAKSKFRRLIKHLDTENYIITLTLVRHFAMTFSNF